MSWKTNITPQQTLSIKFLKQIMTEKEFNALIKKYMKAKRDALEKSVRKECATDPEK